MKMKTLLAMAVLGTVGGLFGEALQEAYYSPFAVRGRYATQMSKVPETPTLVAQGAKLSDFENTKFWAYAGSGAMSNPAWAQSYFTHAYRDGNGVLQFLVTTVQKYDDKYIKGVTIKLTQGEEGVLGQQLETPYIQTDSKNLTTHDFVNLASDGSITYNCTKLGNYNFYCFNGGQWVQKTPELMFANPTGSPVLTVDDLKNYRFTGYFVGSSVNNPFTPVSSENKYITYDSSTGKATKIRFEMQLMDDKFLKCAVLELTDGAEGVYAQNVQGVYVQVANNDAWVAVGFPFLKADGSTNNVAAVRLSSVSDAMGVAGYGVAGLAAIATNERIYNLNASKTWSELTGSTDPVDDDTLDIIVNVTGAMQRSPSMCR